MNYYNEHQFYWKTNSDEHFLQKQQPFSDHIVYSLIHDSEIRVVVVLTIFLTSHSPHHF
ncbi:unnamed protein product [Schistosoma curassoni]|uniref:Ovule protein n=1 Tax=Schistosoma curassoni TaxID=6186 RepID=A0A183JLZ9_9TREM|nr:unnamed protein product [Schistosoma curassoni]